MAKPAGCCLWGLRCSARHKCLEKEEEWFPFHGQRLQKAVQKAPVPSSVLLYAKVRVSAALANTTFQRKVYIRLLSPLCPQIFIY